MLALYWWVDRWRKSTAYTDMTLEEQGAYRNLLDEATLRGGALPNDERILAKACGDPRAWRRVRAAVLPKFFLNEHDGCLHNEQLDKTLESSQKRIDKQRRYRDRLAKERNENRNASGNTASHNASNNRRYQDQDQDQDDGSTEQNHQEAPPPAVVGGTTTRTHKAHVPGFCDWCCLPLQFLEEQAVGPVNRSALLAWAHAVREAWAGQVLDRARYWQFWKDRYREAVIALTPTAREQADYATLRRSIGPGRYGETIPTLEQFVARRRQSADGQPVTPRLADYLERTIPA